MWAASQRKSVNAAFAIDKRQSFAGTRAICEDSRSVLCLSLTEESRVTGGKSLHTGTFSAVTLERTFWTHDRLETEMTELRSEMRAGFAEL